jgi:hypothetical protein
MLIVDGPERVGTRFMGYSTDYPGTAYQPEITNLPGGTYKLLFYPADNVPTSQQIINGKTVNYYPTTMLPCYPEQIVTIPEYVTPVISTPLSGGILYC